MVIFMVVGDNVKILLLMDMKGVGEIFLLIVKVEFDVVKLEFMDGVFFLNVKEEFCDEVDFKLKLELDMSK